MKCQHCGINFEDGERFCPICGERAGSKGRLSETGKPLFPHKTVRPRVEKKTERESVRSAIDPQYESVRTTAQHKTHSHEARPIGTKAVPSAMPKKSGGAKGSRKAGAIIAAVVVLVNFIPTIISLIEDSTANFPERLPDFVYDFTDGDSSHDYDNADTYIDLSILVGEQIELPLSDGATLALYFEPARPARTRSGISRRTARSSMLSMAIPAARRKADSWYDEENFPTENHEFYLTWMTKTEEAGIEYHGSALVRCARRERHLAVHLPQPHRRQHHPAGYGPLGLFGDTDIYELNPTALI